MNSNIGIDASVVAVIYGLSIRPEYDRCLIGCLVVTLFLVFVLTPVPDVAFPAHSGIDPGLRQDELHYDYPDDEKDNDSQRVIHRPLHSVSYSGLLPAARFRLLIF
jgi:hypothetical protein